MTVWFATVMVTLPLTLLPSTFTSASGVVGVVGVVGHAIRQRPARSLAYVFAVAPLDAELVEPVVEGAARHSQQRRRLRRLPRRLVERVEEQASFEVAHARRVSAATRM